MPESVNRRLKVLERRIDKIDPRKATEAYFLNVDRKVFDQAKALIKALPPAPLVAVDRELKTELEALEKPLEPREPRWSPTPGLSNDEDEDLDDNDESEDESSDSSRLRNLRRMSNTEYRNSW